MYSITWRHHLQLIVNVDRFPEFIQEVDSEAVDIGFAVWSQAGGLFSGNHMPFGTRIRVSRFDVKIGPDFLDMGRSDTCSVVSAQHFRCVGATNVFRDVFGNATGDSAK